MATFSFGGELMFDLEIDSWFTVGRSSHAFYAVWLHDSHLSSIVMHIYSTHFTTACVRVYFLCDEAAVCRCMPT
jgi:hypothetical protein